MRVAIYFVPPQGSALARLADDWLGRDAFTNAATREPDPERDGLVAEPARYGFHATMKAPFRPAEGRDLQALDAGLAAFCAARAGVAIGALSLARIGAFFALVPARREDDLHALADAVVTAFEPFRAPLTEAETARRRPESLSARQRAHLADWGYPYVFNEFRFHMTLTGPVEEDEADATARRLGVRFAPVLGRPLAVDGLAIVAEPAPGEPFRVVSRHAFGA